MIAETATRKRYMGRAIYRGAVTALLPLVAIGSAQHSAAAAEPVPLVTIKEVMEMTITPATNTLWNVPERPTDEQWAALEQASITLLVAAGSIARGGAGQNDAAWVGNPAWSAFNEVMIKAGVDARKAIRARDSNALLAAGDALYPPCEGCHLQFNPGVAAWELDTTRISEGHMDSTRKLWIGLGALLVVSFAVLLLMGGEIYRNSRRCPSASSRKTGTSCTPAPTSRAAARSGNRWAACSSARSGATAAMLRRTGAPTGCIAKRSRCSTSGRSARERRERYDGLPAERAAPHLRGRLEPRMRRTPTIRDAHDHARCGPRRGHRERRRALRKPVRQRSRHGGAARSLRDEERHGARCGASPRADRVLLVDRLGRHDGAARQPRHLHEQLARRAADRQSRRRRPRICGRRSACCS